VARLLHRGPYADEGPSLAALYSFVERAGLVPAGPHTEVYLTDPSTTPPAQLRTLLQVPVSRWV
jgi:effector-binding domain-containing protein